MCSKLCSVAYYSQFIYDIPNTNTRCWVCSQSVGIMCPGRDLQQQQPPLSLLITASQPPHHRFTSLSAPDRQHVKWIRSPVRRGGIYTASLSPLFTASLLSLSLSVSLCVCFSSSLLGSWSARGCRAVLVDSFRTKCVCDRLSTFAILARLNPEMVSPTKPPLTSLNVTSYHRDRVMFLQGFFSVNASAVFILSKGRHCHSISTDPLSLSSKPSSVST